MADTDLLDSYYSPTKLGDAWATVHPLDAGKPLRQWLGDVQGLSSGSNNVLLAGAVADGKSAAVNVTVVAGQKDLWVSSPIFSPSDVGKIINAVRTDLTYNPWTPWYATTQGYTAVPKILSYVSATHVILDTAATATAYVNAPDYPAQSWPYNNTPSLVMWGTDNSPAFQKTLDVGGDILVPPGTYALGQQLVMKSYSRLRGAKRASVLMPLGVVPGSNKGAGQTGTTSNICRIIVNSAYNNYWNTYQGTGQKAGDLNTLLAAIGDTGIFVEDLSFDLRMKAIAVGDFPVFFFALRNGGVRGCYFTGTNFMPYSGPNCAACDAIDMSRNYYDNCYSAFNPWCGCTNLSFDDNIVLMANDPKPNGASGDPASVFWFNIVGTQPGDTQISSGFSCRKNRIWMNGSSRSGGAYGIGCFPDGFSNVYHDCVFEENLIYCAGSNNHPINVTGTGFNISISRNLIYGYSGSVPAIQGTLRSDTPAGLSSASTVSGNTSITLNWTAHGFDAKFLSLAPVWIYFNSSVSVGGITLNGYFRLLGVPDVNSMTIRAQVGKTPTSTQTTTWTPGYVAISTGLTGLAIEGNQFVNCDVPSGYLIQTQGPQHVIRGNGVRNTYGTNPSYLSMIRADGINDEISSYVLDNSGPAGTGSLGGLLGDAYVCWNQYEPAPVQGPKYLSLVPTTPASSSAAGTAGQVEVDTSYIYVCTATNTWKRAALTSF